MKDPVTPKFKPGDLVRMVFRGPTLKHPGTGKAVALDRGALLAVVSVLPTGEWGLPEWPRYELRTEEKGSSVPSGMTVRLDETALAPDGPAPADRPEPTPTPPEKPRTQPKLFDPDQE